MQKYISLKLIKKAKASHSWNTLCYYVWLRYHYQKPIFYNYSTRTIGAILNVSPTTASKHINIMIHLGWAKVQNSHLILLSNRETVENSKNLNKKKDLVKVIMFRTKADQVTYLKNIEINNSIFQQQKKIKKKAEVVRKGSSTNAKLSNKQLRGIAKAGGIIELERRINNRTTLSNRKIGVIFGVSKRTASRYQVAMNKLGVMKSIPHYEKENVNYFERSRNQFLSFNGKGFLARKANTITPPSF
jgi:hypothetical protein